MSKAIATVSAIIIKIFIVERDKLKPYSKSEEKNIFDEVTNKLIICKFVKNLAN